MTWHPNGDRSPFMQVVLHVLERRAPILPNQVLIDNCGCKADQPRKHSMLYRKMFANAGRKSQCVTSQYNSSHVRTARSARPLACGSPTAECSKTVL